MANPKVNGYAHPRSNPDSRLNGRRRRAEELLRVCRSEHPQDEAGRCLYRYVFVAAEGEGRDD